VQDLTITAERVRVKLVSTRDGTNGNCLPFFGLIVHVYSTNKRRRQ
jgi:hypothetical protein